MSHWPYRREMVSPLAYEEFRATQIALRWHPRPE